MIRSLRKLAGAAIHATDGDLGKVSDFYFDDLSWTVRYLVVETGNWLTGRVVLVSTLSADRVEWDQHRVDVSLTRDQVRRSPDIDTAQPIARAEEARILQHYGWSSYWSSGVWGPWVAPSPGAIPDPSAGPGSVAEDSAAAQPDTESHLRSVREVLGYYLVHGQDELGRVDDLLVQVVNWSIQYVVIQAGPRARRRPVALQPSQITGIEWQERSLFTGLGRAAVESLPQFDPEHPDDAGPWDKAAE